VKNIQQAERIVTDLERAGCPLSDISVLFPDTGGTREFAIEKNTKAPEGAVAGSPPAAPWAELSACSLALAPWRSLASEL
jgi:hypothetical protein